MNAYDLPTSLTIGGVGFAIRPGWRYIMRILAACNDPDVSPRARCRIILKVLYPKWKEIPPDCVEEAIRKACDFIDCGQKDDGKPKPRVLDWEQDAAIIIPEINKVAGREIRLDPNIHWWTFMGWFMGIGDGLFASVLHIRQKKAKGQKLERWERDFYEANKSICDLQRRYTAEERAEIDEINKWLNG